MRHTLSVRAICSASVTSPQSTSAATRFIHRLRNTGYQPLPRNHSYCSILSSMSQHGEIDSEAALSPDPSTAPRSTTIPEEGTSKSGRAKHQKRPPKRRNTHFLCFPLVTEKSIPQLDKALRHFRDVTTKPARDAGPDKRSGSQEDASNALVQTSTSNVSTNGTSAPVDELRRNETQSTILSPSNPDLQILPAIAHRPPGTFHLTLGVMDLSTQEEMDRALKLLQEVDYAEIFGTVSSEEAEATHRIKCGSHIHQPTEAIQTPQEDNQSSSRLESLQRQVSPPTVNARRGKQQTGFSKTNPPQIHLTGLSTFPSAKSSRVFYAKPSPSSESPFPLLEFGKAIQSRFREAGFITETRPLVLHATVANMRYATQARGGRTSKGKTWRFGKARWQDGQVDARELITCFDECAGDVDVYTKGTVSSQGASHEFIWAENIIVNRVAICKMGAEKSDDKVLGMVYPPLGEKEIFS